VLDAERRLRYEGRFDDARLEERVTKRDVEEALDALLAGREVPVPRTQAFGCSLEILGDQRAFALPRPSGMFPVSAAAETPSVRPLALGAGLSLAAIGSWALLGLAALTGAGSLLNHDALIHGGVNGPPPIWAAILSFAIAWQVMLAAMMIPASGPAIRVVGAALSMRARPVLEAAGFVAAFAAVWSAVGVALFCGDWVLHHIVDATPWLAARPQLIQAAVFATAGAYQLTPWKRRGLAACRDPEGVAACCLSGTSKTGVRAGIRHAIDCLGASWALMLLMFAFGPAALAWMVALTGIMAVEVRARAGSEIALIVGIALLAIAGARLLGVPIAV